MITGRLISQTGHTAIFPSLGLIPVAAGLLVFALYSASFGTRLLSVLLFVIGLFMGTVMGVVQVTVQRAAGSHYLGAAAASVQFSRSVGAAVGTAFTGMVLFGTIAVMDQQAAGLFAGMVETGPTVLASLPWDRRTMIEAEIATAFKAAFLTIAAFAVVGVGLAWSIPVRRI